MQALTIQEAAEITGWSPRMLRYIESAGLVEPDRSVSGYRLYGPEHLQRLRTLRELIQTHGISLSDVGFAQRLRRDPALASDVDQWLSDEARRPDEVDPGDWLRFEQAKHEQLLALTAPHTTREIA